MCPGCGYLHQVIVDGSRGWTFNGDEDWTTISLSVLVRTGSAVDASFRNEIGDPPTICHSFATNGQIRFLSDSTHAPSGQTVDLPTIERPA